MFSTSATYSTGSRQPRILPAPPTSASPDLPAIRFNSGGAHAHETESYESFNQRYQTFFSNVEDVFELQRGLNNCFAYDLVPSTGVIESALKAARKVDDYATAVRILEGVKEKVENKGQYEAYLEELKPVISELGEFGRRLGGFSGGVELIQVYILVFTLLVDHMFLLRNRNYLAR